MSATSLRAGYAKQRALLTVLALGVFMVNVDSRVVVPLLPTIAHDLHSSVSATGMMITAYTLPYGLFQLAYGPLADRFGRLRIIAICMCIFSAGTFLCGLAPELNLLNVLRFVTGSVAAGMFPLALAYIGEVFPYERRQPAIGTLMTATALANVLSTGIGGVIANFASWRVVFLLYGVLAMALSPVLLRQREERMSRGNASLMAGYRRVFENPASRLFLPMVFVQGVLILSPYSYMGGYLADRFHLGVGAAGLLLATYGLAALVSSRMLGRLTALLDESVMLVGGTCLVGISYLIAALEPTWWLFPLAMLLSGAGFIASHTTLQTRSTELAPDSRGTGVAVFAFVLFLGIAGGTAGAGTLVAHAGYVSMLLISAAASLVFGASLWFSPSPGHADGFRPGNSSHRTPFSSADIDRDLYGSESSSKRSLISPR